MLSSYKPTTTATIKNGGLSVVTHAVDPSTTKAEATRFSVTGYPGPHSKILPQTKTYKKNGTNPTVPHLVIYIKDVKPYIIRHVFKSIFTTDKTK